MARRALQRCLSAAVLILAALGLCVEIANHRLHRPALQPVVALLSLSFEHNLPTWYSSSLLLGCALALAAVAGRVPAGARFRRHWWGLAVVFAFMSLDEAIEIHEHLGGPLRLGGVLYFSWIVPAAALLVVFAASYLRFVANLPTATRRRFIAAGVVYVGGALLMELPLGWWTARSGDDNLGYAVIDWVEEVLEMVGATMFLLSVLRHLGEMPPASAPARQVAERLE